MRNNWWKKGAAALCAVLLMSTGVNAEGLDIFGQASGENNNLAIPEQTFAAEGDLIALDEVGITIVADDYTSIREEDGFVYVYTDADGSIPYVIIGRYDMVSDDFAAEFTEYMSGIYSDLRVTSEAAPLVLNGTTWTKIQYEYTISGYTGRDTRLFCEQDGSTYMFGSKEVPSIAFTVPEGTLEKLASSMAVFDGEEDFENYVDAETSVEGSGPSVAELGGFSTPQQGQAGTEETDGETPDNTVGASDGGQAGETVGGTVGGINAPASESSGSITFTESVADYEGTWVSFEDGFRLYLPSDWSIYTVSDEMRQDGILYQAGDSSQADGTPWISVNFGSSEGLTSLRDIAEVLEYGGYTIDDIFTVNGIDCVSYTEPDSDLCGLMFFHPQGLEYVVCVVGFSYSRNVDTIAAVLCSLSPDA